jgi:hypothetical protein
LFPTRLSIALIGVVVALSLPSPARASSTPSLQVAPHTATVGNMVTVRASHVRPNTIMFLLLTPDYQKPRYQRLMGYVRSNGSGDVNQRVRIPSVLHCGKATITLFNSQVQKPVSARLTLAGCKFDNPPKKKIPPPPPVP